ncbi:mycofactocin biosynthesis peptidyl-dipeptidase MftE [Nocardioides sp. CER19]|nr:mycofactocin biosynthesis peptidyl-dipeptidase MftE [Nocardioides sp. CER19]MDH2416133.1 mycofactocin biosynthesis peptidyl-dipeptidase MftE [Nocardioides sp. CER19]
MSCGPWTPWPDLPIGPVVLVPTGSMEQHGPHLPLDTDTVIASAVANGIAARIEGEVFVAPPIAYGASGEHEAFPGTVSQGSEALAHMLLEVGRSLRHWALRYVFVNGHGGNVAALETAVRRLQSEGDTAQWVPCAVPDADPHAGRTETSLMLHLMPERVRLGAARPGNVAPLAEILPELRARGVRAVSSSGVLGDPRGASPAAGEAILADMIDRAVRLITADGGPPGKNADPARRVTGTDERSKTISD